MRVYVKEADGTELDAHYFNDVRTVPDMFGKTVGYRVAPRGEHANWSANGVMYRSIDDAAAHLANNKGWGLRVTKPGSPPSLRFRNIYVDGKAI